MNLDLNYEYVIRKEKAKHWIATLAPRWLVYYCAIRLFAHATTGEHSTTEVPALTAVEALKRWEPR